jgi:alkaline phosphatase D
MPLRWEAVAQPKPAAGFGIPRFNKPKRTITLKCWPQNVDVTDPNARQHPGGPKTIRQADNYGRQAAAELPALTVGELEDAVVQVIDQSDGQIVYTLRIKSRRFRPKVFQPGQYTIKVGQQEGRMKELHGIEAVAPDVQRELRVHL